MKVILLEELPGRGGEGDVIEVARGFANNYLLRKGIAVKATDGNLKQLDQRRNNIAKREEVRIADAEELKTKLEAAPVTIEARVGEEGNLFGSVTAQMIADAVKEQLGVEVDRRRIDVRKAIKVLGEHTVDVSLYRDIKATIALSVVDENGEVVPAEAEAEAAPEAAEAEVEAAEEAVEAAEAEEAAEEASEESADEE